MAGEHLADTLVWFCVDCCMLYSLLLYVVDLCTVVTLSTTSWNTNFTASFCAGLTNLISGVFRISVRAWDAVDADRGGVWSRRLVPSPGKYFFSPQNDKSGCTLTQYGTDRKHGQSLEALWHGFYTKNHGQSQTKAWAVAPSPRHLFTHWMQLLSVGNILHSQFLWYILCLISVKSEIGRGQYSDVVSLSQNPPKNCFEVKTLALDLAPYHFFRSTIVSC